MNFKALKSIFGVGFVSFSMLLGVSISSAFAVESTKGHFKIAESETYPDCGKNSGRTGSSDRYGFSISWKQNFIDAAMRGDFEMVQNLLSHVDINCKNVMGYTALHFAASEGHLPVVEFLLGNNATVDCIGFEGDTPLHAAALFGHLEVVKCLMAYGAEVDSVDTIGRTPLYLAAMRGHLDVVKWLVKNGADANHVASDGSRPIDVAWHMGKIDVIEFLEPYSVSADDECREDHSVSAYDEHSEDRSDSSSWCTIM